MNLINKTPLTLAEVKAQLPKSDEQRPVDAYLKKFAKQKPADAKKQLEALRDLKNLKLKESHLVKLVDLQPKDAEDVHKVVNDVSLSEEEANAIVQALGA
ncbi:hypothetical protein CMI48_00470 [Candidatus Pacearchaeota archaeon]|jgi:DNA-directed RNA polymerase subunit F|nr:hypothetical protein [Candidatus Pacearchaeota archaeon]